MEWREVCQYLSQVTTLLAHIVLQKLHIPASHASEHLFLYIDPCHNLEF